MSDSELALYKNQLYTAIETLHAGYAHLIAQVIKSNLDKEEKLAVFKEIQEYHQKVDFEFMPDLDSIQHTYDTFHELKGTLIDQGILDEPKGSFSIIREGDLR